MKPKAPKSGQTRDGDRRRKTELEATLARFLDMSYADQLEFCQRVSSYLPLTKGVGPLLDEVLERRRASLDCIRRAQQHLGLDRPPTVKEYARAARELGLPWSWQQIQRLWGAWLFAINALETRRMPKTAAERSFRRRHAPRRRRREECLYAVRLWLATKPASDRARDFDDWARERNYTLAPGEQPVPRQVTIPKTLALRWTDVLAIARGEKTHASTARARRENRDWSRGQQRLISLSTIALMRGESPPQVSPLTRRSEFPLPVASFGGRRAWMFDEVEAYLRGEKVPRGPENRLRHLYLDVSQYAALIGLSPNTIAHTGGDIQPLGMVGGCRYWSRVEVETWVSRHRHVVERRKAETWRPGTGPVAGGSDFVGTTGVMKLLSTDRSAAVKLIHEPGFPKPVATFGTARVWRTRDVEAYVAGAEVDAVRENALQAKLLDAGHLGDLLALSRATVKPSETQLPPPVATIGARHLWHADDVETWIAGLEARHRARINRRRARRGLPPV
jgi:predicted DNA-binding transcriptional regulator AlpA